MPVVFFVIAASLFPLGVGPEPQTLRQIAPGVVWVCALLAAMLSVTQVYAGDFADGSLEQMMLSGASGVAIVAAKTAAHWTITGLPLLVAAPLFGVMFDMSAPGLQALFISLVLGTPILSLLGEQPMHGYQVMQELETRSGGRWRPSAGSVYPTLQQLEDERLVSVDEVDGRRTFQLTNAGREAARSVPGPNGDNAWTGGRERGSDLRGLTREIGIAAMQVARFGAPATVDAAATILGDARRDLYRLLADEGPASTADAEPAGSEPEAD